MTTNKPEVVGFATHHDEPMLLPSKGEATIYCDDGEEPVALIRLSDYEALQAECDELRTALAESRANDQQAMRYLNQVREIVGGDDFPDMVRRCEKLRKDAERYRHLRDRLTGPTFDNLFFLELYNAGAFDHPDDVDDAVDDAVREVEHDS